MDKATEQIIDTNSPRFRLAWAIDDIQSLYDDMFELLDKKLSVIAKEFYITYKKNKYHFRYSFDIQEMRQISRIRHKFIDIILRDAIRMAYGNNKKKRDHAWDIVFAMMDGVDLKDHQFEKVDEQEVSAVLDSDGNQLKSISLNLRNYQVKENLGMLDNCLLIDKKDTELLDVD